MKLKRGAKLVALLRPNLYWGVIPHHKQEEFLAFHGLRGFYGGAGGGGKSTVLLLAALQYVDQPNYNALIVRQTYQELVQPGALMSMARQWLSPTDAHWDSFANCWRFPSGATLTFGHFGNDNTERRYHGAEYQFIGVDEATDFTPDRLQFLFTRLRRTKESKVPLRWRATGNPGGPSHDYLRQEFIEPQNDATKLYLPAKATDNPSLDLDEWRKGFAHVDAKRMQRILNGDWSVRDTGNVFNREWFTLVREAPKEYTSMVRYWDCAATEPHKSNPDPDWTAGCLVGRVASGKLYVLDVCRTRNNPAEVDRLIRQTAEIDRERWGNLVIQVREQGPGETGVWVKKHWSKLLEGFPCQCDNKHVSKGERAAPVSTSAEAGNILVLSSGWAKDFLDELEIFPAGAHDDQVDALTGGYAILTQGNGVLDYMTRVIEQRKAYGETPKVGGARAEALRRGLGSALVGR